MDNFILFKMFETFLCIFALVLLITPKEIIAKYFLLGVKKIVGLFIDLDKIPTSLQKD